MSGTVGTFPFPTALGTVPAEGSKVAKFGINWPSVFAASHSFITNINLLSQFQSGQFKSTQAVFVDNSTNIYPVSITCAESGQTVSVGPFSQGMFPLISSAAAQYAITLGVVPLPAGNTFPLGSTTLHFLNTQQPPYAIQELAGGTNFQTVNGVIPVMNAAVQLLAGLPDGQHYAISAFALTLASATAAAAFAAAGPIQVYLEEGATTFFPWRDAFFASTAPGLFYSKQTLFPQPSMQTVSANALTLNTTSNGGVTGPFAGPVGGYLAVWEVTYGIVTIQ